MIKSLNWLFSLCRFYYTYKLYFLCKIYLLDKNFVALFHRREKIILNFNLLKCVFKYIKKFTKGPILKYNRFLFSENNTHF